MSFKKLLSALAEDLPVLFCYIGWANYYDGTEPVVGGHGYLKGHPTDCAESRAFAKDADGDLFYCGIGRGDAPQLVHVVFVALDPERQTQRIVGLYAAAEVELHETMRRDKKTGKKVRDLWAEAHTKNAVWIPIDRRPSITVWETGQGQRRWASRASGRQYPALRKTFGGLKRDLPRLLEKPPQDKGEDQTYSGMEAREGQQRDAMVKHRSREAKLRKAKVTAALHANGGRLLCEVPGCGFDFFARYGDIGYGYAHVHHREPLSTAGKSGRKTTLKDLAIVCANCHSMIHYGGECRNMETLIPRNRKRLKEL